MTRSAARRTWLAVIGIAIALGLGTFALVRWAPPPVGAAVGDRAPTYRVARVDTGDSVSLPAAFAGDVTLLNVWATWCIPCRTEMPSIERVYRDYRARGFRVAATSIDNGAPSLVASYGRDHALTFDLLQDQSGGIQSSYDMIGVPESFLLDRKGRITWIGLGAEQWDSPDNRARIERLLDGGD